MRRWLRFAFVSLAAVVLVLVAVVAGGAWWATHKREALLAQTFEIPPHPFPIPFPLSEEELAALRAERSAAVAVPEADAPAVDPLAGVDLEALALERAIARGDHLVHARYACFFCHGADLGGGTMIDDPMIGTLQGPNLTAGEGSVTTGYTATDWDRKVRHGINRTGNPGFMPSMDFFRMTDQELSDVVAYVQSRPPIDRVVEPISYGPLGTVLIATGQIKLSANIHPGHERPHAALPPPAGPTVEFGAHVAGVCVGCHTDSFAGGPIPGGDPAWVPAANLTPHEDGVATWTVDDFEKLMRTGLRPDGTPTRVPMAEVLPLGNAMTDTEIQALWAFLRSLPPLPDPA